MQKSKVFWYGLGAIFLIWQLLMLVYAIKHTSLSVKITFSPFYVFWGLILVKTVYKAIERFVSFIWHNKVYITLTQNIDVKDIVAANPKFPVRSAYNLEIIVFERTTVAFFNSLLRFWPHRHSKTSKFDKEFFTEQLADFNEHEYAQFAVYLQMRGVQRYIIGLKELFNVITSISNAKHEELQGSALNASERCN